VKSCPVDLRKPARDGDRLFCAHGSNDRRGSNMPARTLTNFCNVRIRVVLGWRAGF
jgi:hypothetical protein